MRMNDVKWMKRNYVTVEDVSESEERHMTGNGTDGFIKRKIYDLNFVITTSHLRFMYNDSILINEIKLNITYT